MKEKAKKNLTNLAALDELFWIVRRGVEPFLVVCCRDKKMAEEKSKSIKNKTDQMKKWT